MRDRISKVKKPLPNLGGRATQLPPLDRSKYMASKRSSSTAKRMTNQGRQSNPSAMFAGNDLNQSSAGAIPINSMYSGEAER